MLSSSECKSGGGSDTCRQTERQVITVALRDQPYIPLYVMDFATDEKLANCSAESTGVYIRLMCILHKMEDYGVIELKAKDKQNGGDTVHDFALKLVRQMPYEVTCIERSLRELIDEGVITLEGDKLYQKRMVKDGDISRKRAEAGARRGKPKEAPEQANDEQTSQQKASKTPANEEAEQDEPKQEAPKKDLIEERFSAFWKAYPRKSGKGGARKSWNRIAPTQELFEKIMAALEAAKSCEQWRKDNGQYIPYPATWLNQERWDDDYGTPSTAKNSPPANFDPDNPYADWGDGQ